MSALKTLTGLFVASLALVWGLSVMAMPTRTKATPAKPVKSGKIVITIDLSQQKIWVDKYTRKGNFRIDGQMLPIVKGSMHTGHFRPTKIYNRFRTVSGNTYLENVIFFDGARAIRTTRLFPHLLKEGTQVSGQVNLEADFGQILYETVHDYGVANTEIRVRK